MENRRKQSAHFFWNLVYIDLLKLKAYKLFENSDADLTWLLFSKKPTCVELSVFHDSS